MEGLIKGPTDKLVRQAGHKNRKVKFINMDMKNKQPVLPLHYLFYILLSDMLISP
jgi:hypothetical protein